jgi:C-type mannose receptor
MRAKFVRSNPQSWDQYGIALRVELVGCRHSECSEVELISGDNHYLSDGHLSASSQRDGNHGPGRSRLHEKSSGDMSGGWAPEYMDDQQWLQVDLGYSVVVTGVAIQGQDATHNFVTKFYVSYSHDLEEWINHREPGDNQTVRFGRTILFCCEHFPIFVDLCRKLG